MLRRWLRRGCLVLGSICLLVAAGYSGWLGYLAWRESASPSTHQVLVLRDGQQVPLTQPTAPPAQPANDPPSPTVRSSVAPSPTPLPTLPPERIRIPKIDVDWPVVLSTTDHLPKFKGVGWLLGSAYPGALGNIVLFGHLGGAPGTFMRLHEVQPGDEFVVVTATGEHRYRVRARHETTPDDVSVLAPTSTATATLITCSGPWDPVAQTNERRLIVQADYVGSS